MTFDGCDVRARLAALSRVDPDPDRARLGASTLDHDRAVRPLAGYIEGFAPSLRSRADSPETLENFHGSGSAFDSRPVTSTPHSRHRCL